VPRGGLSKDPKKAAAQLANLAAGREKRAANRAAGATGTARKGRAQQGTYAGKPKGDQSSGKPKPSDSRRTAEPSRSRSQRQPAARRQSPRQSERPRGFLAGLFGGG
jgi:hypothetical protein